MRTFISELRKLRAQKKAMRLIPHGNRINAVEKRNNKLAVIRAQLDLMYGNPVTFGNRIERLEAALNKIN